VGVVGIVIEFSIQDDHIERNEYLNYGKSIVEGVSLVMECFVKV
jgi:hypothetical protein